MLGARQLPLDDAGWAVDDVNVVGVAGAVDHEGIAPVASLKVQLLGRLASQIDRERIAAVAPVHCTLTPPVLIVPWMALLLRARRSHVQVTAPVPRTCTPRAR